MPRCRLYRHRWDSVLFVDIIIRKSDIVFIYTILYVCTYSKYYASYFRSVYDEYGGQPYKSRHTSTRVNIVMFIKITKEIFFNSFRVSIYMCVYTPSTHTIRVSI